MGLDVMMLVFLLLSFKSAFLLSSFTLIKRLFSCFSLFGVVSSVYLKLLIFLLAVLIPAYDSSSPIVHVMHPAYKLNKQDDNILPCHTPLQPQKLGYQLGVVMVNFICQPDRATGFPELWSNMILGASVRVCLHEINMKLGALRKQMAFPDVGGLIQSAEDLNRTKRQEGMCSALGVERHLCLFWPSEAD